MIKHRDGFTLIELVIVIVLLGILSAVALPRFFDFTSSSKSAAVNSVIGALRTSLNKHFSDWLAANKPATMKVGSATGNFYDWLHFGSNGFPDGASLDNTDTYVLLSASTFDQGLVICARIFANVINNAAISVGHQSATMTTDFQYGCNGKTYCVKDIQGADCAWQYTEDGNFNIQYQLTTGQMIYQE